MQFDPTQPIMFDTDTVPGRGTGYWQIHPFAPGRNNGARASGKVGVIIFVMILLIILGGAGHMLFA